MRSRWLIIFCLIWLLAACSGTHETIYLPPTAVMEATTEIAASPPEVAPTQSEMLVATTTPDCTDNLTYLNDLTLPDDSVVEAGSRLDKRWKVQNSGTCNWDERYRIMPISGPNLGAQTSALYPARSGTELTIQIIFSAPMEAGTVTSAWQAHDPQGKPFGDPFYIQVIVQNP